MKLLANCLLIATAGCAAIPASTFTGPITVAELTQYVRGEWDRYQGAISRLSGRPRQGTVLVSVHDVRCEVRPSESTCEFQMVVRFEDGSEQTMPFQSAVMRNEEGLLVYRGDDL